MPPRQARERTPPLPHFLSRRSNCATSADAAILHALDVGAQRAQPLIDALVAALDLPDVVDDALAVRAQGRQEHRHARANVRRLDAPGPALLGTHDDAPMRFPPPDP